MGDYDSLGFTADMKCTAISERLRVVEEAVKELNSIIEGKIFRVRIRPALCRRCGSPITDPVDCSTPHAGLCHSCWTFAPGRKDKSKIVCLCGSLRFLKEFRRANLKETLKGNIVLTVGCDMKSDAESFRGKTAEEFAEIKRGLEELHLRKIELADEVLILNKDGYIGESTRSELEHARRLGRTVRFLEREEPANVVEGPLPRAVVCSRETDDRGWVTPFLNAGGAGLGHAFEGEIAQVYATHAYGGKFKGWHRHAHKTDRFCVVCGDVWIYAWKGERRFYWANGLGVTSMQHRQTGFLTEPLLVEIPPGWWHGYRATDDNDHPACIVNAPDRAYDPEHPDQDEMAADDPDAPQLEEFCCEGTGGRGPGAGLREPTPDPRPPTPEAD